MENVWGMRKVYLKVGIFLLEERKLREQKFYYLEFINLLK